MRAFALARLAGPAAGRVTTFRPDRPAVHVDASWPKPLPNNWLLGQVANVAVDSNDHVWVLQRPRTLTDDEKGATLKPPRNKCCAPAPSVMEFDADGNFVQGWGFPDTKPWVAQRARHLFVDRAGAVWISGNANDDSAIYKFSRDGKHPADDRRGRPDRRQQRHHQARPAGDPAGRRGGATSCSSPTATATAA